MDKVLITGGSGGIAKAIAKCLNSHWVLFCPSRSELDVANLDQIEDHFKNRKYDVVINNAGSIHVATVINSIPEKWISDIYVNLIAPYYVSRLALINGCRTIINISSTAGYAAYQEWSSYCASKAALITLTKCMAAEGIDAYVICPGATDTKFRSYFHLPSDNLMDPLEIGRVVLDILNKKYEPGTSIFIQKGYFALR